MAGKWTFQQWTMKARTWKSGHWTGVGTGVAFVPTTHFHDLEGASEYIYTLAGTYLFGYPQYLMDEGGGHLLTEEGEFLLSEELSATEQMAHRHTLVGSTRQPHETRGPQ